MCLCVKLAMSVNFIVKHLRLNFILLLLTNVISLIGCDNGVECIIGVLRQCNDYEICAQHNHSVVIGRCECFRDCTQHQTGSKINTRSATNAISDIRVSSSFGHLSNYSIIISIILCSALSLTAIFSIYYFGVRRGVFRDIWLRMFTQRTVEHQLLDRSARHNNNNDDDTDAIA